MFNQALLEVGKMLSSVEWPQVPELDVDDVKQKWNAHIRDRAAGRPGVSFTHHEVELLMCCGSRKDYIPSDICTILGVDRRTSYAASISLARFELKNYVELGPGKLEGSEAMDQGMTAARRDSEFDPEFLTAESLLNAATDTMMQKNQIDRAAAKQWLRTAAEVVLDDDN